MKIHLVPSDRARPRPYPNLPFGFFDARCACCYRLLMLNGVLFIPPAAPGRAPAGSHWVCPVFCPGCAAATSEVEKARLVGIVRYQMGWERRAMLN